MKFFNTFFFFFSFIICQNISTKEFENKNKQLDIIIEKNQISKAVELAEDLSKSNYPIVKKKLFLLYLNQEKYILAKKQLDIYKAYQIDPIENQYLNALYLFHKKDLEKSKKILEDILEKKSSLLESLFLLFEINKQQQQNEKVKENLRQMIKINYKSPLVFEALMDYYLTIKKDFKLANKTLKDYKKNFESKFIYFLKYANYFYLVDKSDFALAYINRALNLKEKEDRAMSLKYEILKKHSFEKLKRFLVENKDYFSKKKKYENISYQIACSELLIIKKKIFNKNNLQKKINEKDILTEILSLTTKEMSIIFPLLKKSLNTHLPSFFLYMQLAYLNYNFLPPREKKFFDDLIFQQSNLFLKSGNHNLSYLYLEMLIKKKKKNLNLRKKGIALLEKNYQDYWYELLEEVDILEKQQGKLSSKMKLIQSDLKKRLQKSLYKEEEMYPFILFKNFPKITVFYNDLEDERIFFHPVIKAIIIRFLFGQIKPFYCYQFNFIPVKNKQDIQKKIIQKKQNIIPYFIKVNFSKDTFGKKELSIKINFIDKKQKVIYSFQHKDNQNYQFINKFHLSMNDYRNTPVISKVTKNFKKKIIIGLGKRHSMSKDFFIVTDQNKKIFPIEVDQFSMSFPIFLEKSKFVTLYEK